MNKKINLSGTMSVKELLMCLETYRFIYGNDAKTTVSIMIESGRDERK